MPRGGRRAGAGRKAGQKRAVVLGMDGARKPSFALPAPLADVPADPAGLLEPPVDMAPARQDVWRQLAPHALQERTLIASRAAGFRQLCQEWAYCAELDARIQVLGITSGEADRLLRRLEKWQQALKASLGNFNLRSFGKPVAPEKPKASSNPFGALATR